MNSIPVNIINEYPKRGPLSQYRVDSAFAFHCFRCGQEKKSKLVTLYDSNWSHKLCNGCYGYLLSIYDIKRNEKEIDDKVEELSQLLLKSVNKDKINQQIKLYELRENRSKYLAENSKIFLSTTEFLSQSLKANLYLDWSPVIIGLCKTFELEVVNRILVPLKDKLITVDLSNDLSDKDLSRIASYIVGRSKPPELGSIGYFLKISINSKKRKETSILLNAFYALLKDCSYSDWILDEKGLLYTLTIITSEYRNKAAHLESLSQNDFEKCRELMLGQEGILWKLLLIKYSKK